MSFNQIAFIFMRIGIGRSLAAPPSHTIRHSDHVYGGSAEQVNRGTVRAFGPD
ncbi:MAG: hypothetical protein KKH04_12190 [Proteobacteria bacterium]|nr:hypothetical protein [Pseudomonadota bacterium]